MLFLCQCLVKFAQKESDESSLSLEADSTGFLALLLLFNNLLFH